MELPFRIQAVAPSGKLTKSELLLRVPAVAPRGPRNRWWLRDTVLPGLSRLGHCYRHRRSYRWPWSPRTGRTCRSRRRCWNRPEQVRPHHLLLLLLDLRRLKLGIEHLGKVRLSSHLRVIALAMWPPDDCRTLYGRFWRRPGYPGFLERRSTRHCCRSHLGRSCCSRWRCCRHLWWRCCSR